MKLIRGIEFCAGSREERLPDFAPDFPYIASRVEMDFYPERFVPWHWHSAVELFYMESGSLEYSTPQGKAVFPQGSGGFVNTNVLHMTRPLGPVGKNFAAGMSGGVAYVLDEDSTLYRNLNKAMVSMEKVESKFDREELCRLIEAHTAHTGSAKGRRILAAFEEYLPRFKKIIPSDYKRLVQLASQFEEQGVTPKQAQIEAFYASLAKK